MNKFPPPNKLSKEEMDKKYPPVELNKRIRRLYFYHKWREKIRDRDGNRCQDCRGIMIYDLEVHHKIPLIDIIIKNKIKTLSEAMKCKDIWNMNNVITLCIDCHKKTPDYLIKSCWWKTNHI